MVCPYCSVDMEPIELGGKTFCSNCGLTIGVTPTSTFNNKISTSYSRPNQPISAPVLDTKPTTTSQESETPITDEAKKDLGLPPADDSKIDSSFETTIPKETPEAIKPSEPIKLSVNCDQADVTSISRLANNTNNDGPALELDDNDNTSISIKKDVSRVDNNVGTLSLTQEKSSSNQDAITDTTDLGIGEDDEENQRPSEIDQSSSLIQSVDIPDETDFDAMPAPDSIGAQKENVPTNEQSITEKIREVDTLGASGILLDILNENYHLDESSDRLDTLKAAKNLIDDIDFTTKLPGDSTTNLKSSIKQLNPVEEIELEDPLNELEITSGNQNTQATTNEPTEENINDNLYKLPSEILEQKPVHDEGKMETPLNDISEIKSIEEKLSKLNDPKIESDIVESGDYDPDAMLPLSTEANEEIAPKKKIGKSDTIVDTEKLKTEKQEAVKSFFKEKIEGHPSQKSFFSFLGSKDNRQSRKKSNQKRRVKSLKSKNLPLWLVLSIIVPSVIFLALASIAGYAYYKKPAAQQTRTIEKATVADFSTLTPKSIPAGYTLTSSIYDDKSKSVIIKYTFANDKNKTLSYTQKRSGNTTSALEEYIKSKDSVTFVTKDVDDITYTEFSNGDLVWTKDDFLFTIETINYDFAHDLIYKMAQSIG